MCEADNEEIVLSSDEDESSCEEDSSEDDFFEDFSEEEEEDRSNLKEMKKIAEKYLKKQRLNLQFFSNSSSINFFF